MLGDPRSGAKRAKLNINWRSAGKRDLEPIDVLVNPWGPEAPRMVEALGGGEDRHYRGVRFQLNAAGILWFADAKLATHGDEAHGVLLPEKGSNKDDFWLRAVGVALVSGTIRFPTWELDAWSDLALMGGRTRSSAQRLLEQFAPWRDAVRGTILDPDLTTGPVPRRSA